MTSFYKSYSNKKTAFENKFNSTLGSPTSPMVAKQLEETGKRLNEGVKNVEIGTIATDKFEMIPKQHFEEIRRIAQLTDANISVHAPLVDLAGFPQGEGQRTWAEDQRKTAESQVFSIMERSVPLTTRDEKGKVKANVPIVFHAGHFSSQEYGVPYDPVKHPEGLKKEVHKKDEYGNIKTDAFGNPEIERYDPVDIRSMTIVNQETGDIHRVEHDEKKRIGGRTEIWDVDKRLRTLNQTQWDEEQLKMLNYQKDIEELKEKLEIRRQQNDAIEKTGLGKREIKPGEINYQAMAQNNELDIVRLQRHIQEINQRLNSEAENIFHKYDKWADEKVKDKTKDRMEHIRNVFKEVQTHEDELNEKFNNLSEQDQKKSYKEYQNQLLDLELHKSKVVVTEMAAIRAPKLWVPVGEFAIGKTAETVSNAATNLFKKLKNEKRPDGTTREDEMPFLALENFFVNAPMSRAKDLKEVVKQGRDLITKKLMDDKDLKMSESDARKTAESMLSATWDVGHINNLRKAGFEGEELKELVLRETKEIADVTRHVHITDNFGFFDSHLPPGMGNVPIREIMEILEKKWADQKAVNPHMQDPRSIVEAGGFVAEIGQNPTVGVLEFFGSPLYRMGPSPYFSQNMSRTVGHTYSPYTESFIDFPQQHFNLYGSSFTTLPKSVGGEVSGGNSRFSGTPNQ